MPDTAALLAAYDAELRGPAEISAASEIEVHGPLAWGVLPAGRGFVTYHDLGGATGTALADLVEATVRHYRGDPRVTTVEWKTRGHDIAPGLSALLVGHGFEEGETESVMVGPAAGLAREVPVPDGVVLRTVTAEDDVRRMCAAADRAFQEPDPGRPDALLHQLALGRDDLELWVAEADGEIVCSGRLEPVAGSAFAGLWGGATLPAWRGRGIYRALTAARARSALRRGRTLLHSDSTAFSRPILARSGLVWITSTTPYDWAAGPG